MLVVARRGVELVVDVGRDAVLLTADDTDLDLEDDARVAADLEQLGGDRQVLAQLGGRAVPPVSMSLILEPDANSAPPVENWMIPSLSASAKPRSAALRVSDDVTLTAG